MHGTIKHKKSYYKCGVDILDAGNIIPSAVSSLSRLELGDAGTWLIKYCGHRVKGLGWAGII